MKSKKIKFTQSEIDYIYQDFVFEIASKVAKKVKGKVFYGYASIEDMWYIIIKTRELGEKRFFLDTLDYDMLTGVSSNEISNGIIKIYYGLIEKRFFIIWIFIELKVKLYRKYRLINRIIWSYKYTDSISFKANIMLLISMISSYTYMKRCARLYYAYYMKHVSKYYE